MTNGIAAASTKRHAFEISITRGRGKRSPSTAANGVAIAAGTSRIT